MAKRKTSSTPPDQSHSDYRHAAKRKNNPPAKIAAEGTVPILRKSEYAYNPHLPPALRFDPTGGPDAIPELLHAAQARPLNADEIKILTAALRTHEPWLEWSAKRERHAFTVDPVALHIRHEVIEFLTFDLENPNSILTCLSQARENARAVRPAISNEMWEYVNRCYLSMRDTAAPLMA